jgi:aspartate racemase
MILSANLSLGALGLCCSNTPRLKGSKRLIVFLKTNSSGYNRKMSELNEEPRPDRIIGILGGMGPEATLDLYRLIISLTPAIKDQDHLRVLIYSNPKIPDRTKAIAGTGESPLSFLIGSARLLENGGAGIIAMPCNTAHHYLPEMRQVVSIPILNMIEETSRMLCRLQPEARAVGLLAAIGTVRSGVYHDVLSQAGIELLVPNESDQAKIHDAIAQVKGGVHNRATQETFESIGRRLIESGATAVILGCTEVPLAFNPHTVDYPTLNPTRILAQAAVDWALDKRK